LSRLHFLTLHPGDRFRYEADGPLYRRGPDLGKKGEERATVERWNNQDWVPAGTQDYQGCMVLPVDEPEEKEAPR
jgi:hypothetical protein